MEGIFRAQVPDFDMVRSCVYSLRGRYPFIRAFSIGDSLLGRQIYALSIGEMRDRVLYSGAIHGQEWITALLLLKFAEDICFSLDEGSHLAGMDVRRSLLGRGIVIVPCVNPDGVEIALKGCEGALVNSAQVEEISKGDYSNWNANARGVDIEHNFNFGWEKRRQMEKDSGILGPSPRWYGGTHPESEPEAVALTRLCRDKTFRHVLALHSPGEIVFWKCGGLTPSRSKLMARILATCSGYSLGEAEGLGCCSGFKNWFISEIGRPGFTIMVGKGTVPLPLEHLEGIYQRIVEMLLLAAVM